MLRGGRYIEEKPPDLIRPAVLAKPERRDRAPQLDFLSPPVPGVRVEKDPKCAVFALQRVAELPIGAPLVEREVSRVEKLFFSGVELERGLGDIGELSIALLSLELREQLHRRPAAPGIAAVLELHREHAASHAVQLQLAVYLRHVERCSGAQAGHLFEVELAIVEMAQKIVVSALESFCKRLPRRAPDLILLRTRDERGDENENQAEQARRGPSVGCGGYGLVLLWRGETSTRAPGQDM